MSINSGSESEPISMEEDSDRSSPELFTTGASLSKQKLAKIMPIHSGTEPEPLSMKENSVSPNPELWRGIWPKPMTPPQLWPETMASLNEKKSAKTQNLDTVPRSCSLPIKKLTQKNVITDNEFRSCESPVLIPKYQLNRTKHPLDPPHNFNDWISENNFDRMPKFNGDNPWNSKTNWPTHYIYPELMKNPDLKPPDCFCAQKAWGFPGQIRQKVFVKVIATSANSVYFKTIDEKYSVILDKSVHLFSANGITLDRLGEASLMRFFRPNTIHCLDVQLIHYTLAKALTYLNQKSTEANENGIQIGKICEYDAETQLLSIVSPSCKTLRPLKCVLPPFHIPTDLLQQTILMHIDFIYQMPQISTFAVLKTTLPTTERTRIFIVPPKNFQNAKLDFIHAKALHPFLSNDLNEPKTISVKILVEELDQMIGNHPSSRKKFDEMIHSHLRFTQREECEMLQKCFNYHTAIVRLEARPDNQLKRDNFDWHDYQLKSPAVFDETCFSPIKEFLPNDWTDQQIASFSDTQLLRKPTEGEAQHYVQQRRQPSDILGHKVPFGEDQPIVADPILEENKFRDVTTIQDLAKTLETEHPELDTERRNRIAHEICLTKNVTKQTQPEPADTNKLLSDLVLDYQKPSENVVEVNEIPEMPKLSPAHSILSSASWIPMTTSPLPTDPRKRTKRMDVPPATQLTSLTPNIFLNSYQKREQFITKNERWSQNEWEIQETAQHWRQLPSPPNRQIRHAKRTKKLMDIVERLERAYLMARVQKQHELPEEYLTELEALMIEWRYEKQTGGGPTNILFMDHQEARCIAALGVIRPNAVIHLETIAALQYLAREENSILGSKSLVPFKPEILDDVVYIEDAQTEEEFFNRISYLMRSSRAKFPWILVGRNDRTEDRKCILVLPRDVEKVPNYGLAFSRPYAEMHPLDAFRLLSRSFECRVEGCERRIDIMKIQSALFIAEKHWDQYLQDEAYYYLDIYVTMKRCALAVLALYTIPAYHPIRPVEYTSYLIPHRINFSFLETVWNFLRVYNASCGSELITQPLIHRIMEAKTMMELQSMIAYSIHKTPSRRKGVFRLMTLAVRAATAIICNPMIRISSLPTFPAQFPIAVINDRYDMDNTGETCHPKLKRKATLNLDNEAIDIELKRAKDNLLKHTKELAILKKHLKWGVILPESLSLASQAPSTSKETVSRNQKLGELIHSLWPEAEKPVETTYSIQDLDTEEQELSLLETKEPLEDGEIHYQRDRSDRMSRQKEDKPRPDTPIPRNRTEIIGNRQFLPEPPVEHVMTIRELDDTLQWDFEQLSNATCYVWNGSILREELIRDLYHEDGSEGPSRITIFRANLEREIRKLLRTIPGSLYDPDLPANSVSLTELRHSRDKWLQLDQKEKAANLHRTEFQAQNYDNGVDRVHFIEHYGLSWNALGRYNSSLYNKATILREWILTTKTEKGTVNGKDFETELHVPMKKEHVVYSPFGNDEDQQRALDYTAEMTVNDITQYAVAGLQGIHYDIALLEDWFKIILQKDEIDLMQKTDGNSKTVAKHQSLMTFDVERTQSSPVPAKKSKKDLKTKVRNVPTSPEIIPHADHVIRIQRTQTKDDTNNEKTMTREQKHRLIVAYLEATYKHRAEEQMSSSMNAGPSQTPDQTKIFKGKGESGPKTPDSV
jgi:hypothetical protein